MAAVVERQRLPVGRLVARGVVRQPPLIGAKQLLNVRAVSLPAAGGILAAGALLLGLWAVVVTLRQKRTPAIPAV